MTKDEAEKMDARWRILEEVAQVRSAASHGMVPGGAFPVDGYTLEVDPVLTGRPGGCSVQRMCEEVGVPLASRADANLDGELGRQRATWTLRVVCELSRVVDAATSKAQGRTSPFKLRQSLVTLAAIVLAWIEWIDARPDGKTCDIDARCEKCQCVTRHEARGDRLQCSRCSAWSPMAGGP